MEFVQLLQSIWLGLKARSFLDRIVLSWIGTGLLEQWELDAYKYGTACCTMELGERTWGVSSMQHKLISCVQRDCLRCWILDTTCSKQSKMHQSMGSFLIAIGWVDHPSVRSSEHMLQTHWHLSTAPNDQKQSRDPDQMLCTHCDWMSRSLKRDFGGNPVGQGGQWWKKMVVEFSQFSCLARRLSVRTAELFPPIIGRLPPLQTDISRFCEMKYLPEKETHNKNEENTLKQRNEIFLTVYGLPK